MSQKSQIFDDKDHGPVEEEIILERPGVDISTSLGFSIVGGTDLPFAQNFPYIFVVSIAENGLADRDKRLRFYDIILRVNYVDYTNIKHQTAVQILKNSGNKVRLLIRRFIPQFSKVVELKYQDERLGISIAGGIGSEYFKGDPGIFITGIFDQSDKQLSINDRLLEISSEHTTYDLRFVTYNEARKSIELACTNCAKVKLTLGSHMINLRKSTEKLDVLRREQYDLRGTKDEVGSKDNRVFLRQDQYNPYGYKSERNIVTFQPAENNSLISSSTNHYYENLETIETVLLAHENSAKQMSVESFDFEDYQRYENRSKRHLIQCPTSSITLNVDLQAHLSIARKTNILQYDHKKLREIPSEIFSLSELCTLSLNDNDIQSVPVDLNSLMNLTNLYLRNNQIESLLSIEFTHHLSKLKNLLLSGNCLHCLPATFSYLTALEQLNLSINCFFTIPQAILHLTNLKVLNLSNNRITQIKDEIELLEVDELNLSHNQISQISANISKCKRLNILRLDNNKLELKSIPTSLLKDSTVFQLSVSGNRFEEKQLQLMEGYHDYEERYTTNQRKKD